MDGRTFDAWLRSLTDSRRSVLRGALGLIAGVAGIGTIDAKKRKKKCAKKCADGCCTSKRGKCIQPAQQSPAQCGTGGEICRTNCGGGGGDTCGATCATCCAGGTCIDAGQISNDQCGTGGEACFACPAGQACNAPDQGCCARKGAACGSSGVQCCTIGGVLTCGPDSTCCVPSATTAGGFFASCDSDLDCCDPIDVCHNGLCERPEGATCQPGNLLCASPLTCDGAGICSECAEGSSPCGQGCCPDDNCCVEGVCCGCCHVGDPTFAACCSTPSCCT